MFDTLKAMSQLGPMMAKAREMQAKMAELQQRLGGMQAAGTAGGVVSARVNGRLEVMSIEFSPDAPLTDRIALADLTKAAVNMAMAGAREMVQTEMRKISGDIDLSAMQNMLGA